MKKLICLIGLFVVLVGCTKKNNLSCSDAEVTNTVMDISIKELRDQVFKAYIARKLGGLPKIIANMSYEEYKVIDQEENQGEVTIATEKVISALRLSNIRLKQENEKTGMISCATTITGLDGGSAEIEYTAQHTEDDNIYVEVFGLK